MGMSASALRQTPPAPDAGETGDVVFETSVAEPGLDLATTLRTITARHGKTYQRLLVDLAKASFGPGRLSYDEFIGLRLFDDAWLAGADPSEFVGLDAGRRLWTTANCNSEWWGLMRNKLAVTTLLGGYGFPVIPTLALYSDTLSMRNVPVMRAPGDLASFLRACRDYPLFGKPMDSQRSLGSIGLDAYEPTTDCVRAGERSIPVEAFAVAVARHYGAGYILQRRISPEPRVRAVVGDRLATVRVITMLGENGPEVLRALWKVPSGGNVADNFWRSGNLLATLDLASGRVLRVVRGSGLALEEVTHHPDTGAALVGIEVPNWREVTGLALEAASTLGEVRLIGWDMAATEAGVLIVEPNFTPDFFMVQLADRRGILDERFKAFLAHCKAAAQRAKKKQRSGLNAETQGRLRRLGRDMTGT
jgi:hypothetical protein